MKYTRSGEESIQTSGLNWLNQTNRPACPFWLFYKQQVRQTCFALVMLLLIHFQSSLSAQVDTPNLSKTPASLSRAAVETGSHYKKWSEVRTQTQPSGRILIHTNTFVELATGMHYQENGQWHESKAEILATPEGAAALKGQHKVRFASDANTLGAIDVAMQDGTRWQTHVIGLFYRDERTGRRILLGQGKSSKGEVHPPNQVIYADAFSNVVADLRYTYMRSGVEQDVILRRQLPEPSTYGLDNATTVLEVLTEIVSSFEPTEEMDRVAVKLNAADNTKRNFRFPKMHMPSGKAFFTDSAIPIRQAKLTGRTLPVGKTLETIENRKFLVEAVKFEAMRPHLAVLPVQASVTPGQSGDIEKLLAHIPARIRPASQTPMQLAKAASAKPGFVVDYELVNTSVTDFTFRGDTTYLISGDLYLYGTTTIEGGTVVKYETDPYAGSILMIQGAVVCNTSEFRPAVFTTRNDNTVGEKIPSGPTITNFYQALAIGSENPQLKHLRFRYADFGLHTHGGTLKHSQFVHCGNAFFTTWGTLNLENVLVYDVGKAFWGLDYHIKGTHVTIDQCELLTETQQIPADCSLAFTNSLFSRVSADGDVGGTRSYCQDVAFSDFTDLAGGLHYLPANSALRNAGTPSISYGLWGELTNLTTTKPTLLTGTLSTDLTLSASSLGDQGLPDLGYHYAQLHYVADGLMIASGVTLSLTNGATVGVAFNQANYGIHNSGKFISHGKPLQPIRIIYNAIAQESAVPGTDWNYTSIHDNPLSSAPNLQLTSTEFYQLGGGPQHLSLYTGYQDSFWAIRDSSFFSGGIYLYVYGTAGGRFAFTNSLIENVTTQFHSDCPVYLELWNNLFLAGTLTLHPGPSSGWIAYDNLFDRVSISLATPTINSDYNGYSPGLTALDGSSNNQYLDDPVEYETGPMGNYYTPVTSDLVNAGSRFAANAGLFHATTRVDQTKEGVTKVDIGLHYIAVSGNGQPVDSDGDGLADYIEDTDGNGSYDSAIDLVNFNAPDTDGDNLPDAWEVFFGLNGNNGTGVNGPSGDQDGDLLTNLQEYWLGLNPLLDQSLLPAARRNYVYDRISRVDNVTGVGQVDFTLDKEGNITNVAP